MKMFYKSRYSLVLLLVLSLVMQIAAPVVGNYAYAEEEEIVEEQEEVIETEDVESETVEDEELDSDPDEEDFEDTKEKGDIKSQENEENSEDGDIDQDVDSEEDINREEEESGDEVEGRPSMIMPLDVKYPDVEEVEKHIKKVTILVDKDGGGKKEIKDFDIYEPENGDSITLKIDIEMDAGHKFGEGSTLKYELPDIFTALSGSGKVGDVGDFSIEDGKIKIVFNSSIRDDADQGVEILDASLSIGAKYSETNELIEYELKLPGRETITLNFKPKNGTTITKSGEAENNGKNSKKISWVVDINTELNHLEDVLFKDDLSSSSGNHKYDKESLEIFELDINAKGDLTETEESITVDLTPNIEDKELSFILPDGKKAYRIKYDTIIDEDDADEGIAFYKNEAEFNNNPATVEPVKVEWGTPLEKSVSKSDNGFGGEANWTVKYNFNRRTITKENAVLTDEIEGEHEIEESTFKVYEVDEEGNKLNDPLEQSSNYKVAFDTDGKGYKLSFDQDINEPYIIEYTTKRVGYFDKGGEISNLIKRIDGKDGKDGKGVKSGFDYKNPGIVKSSTDVDYKDKTMGWKIEVNKDRYPMKNIDITDIYNGEGMKMVEESFKVEGLEENQYTFNKIMGDDVEIGFTLILNEGVEINEPFTISYRTEYSIKNIGKNDRKYKNNVDLKARINENEYESSDSAEATIKAEQKENGYKTGYYDYETKEFYWTVGINFNLNTIDKAVFKDSLSEGQKVLLETVKVQPVKLDKNGNMEPDGDPLIVDPSYIDGKENKFEINLGKITGAHEITYTSVDSDGIFPKTIGNVKVKNNAELWDDQNLNSSWEHEITIKYTNETIKKEGSGFNQTSKIKWNFKLNYGQSKLSDVKILDVVGKDEDGNPNQFILEDSFKIYEVKLTGNTSKNENPSEEKTEIKEGFEVDVNNVEGKFELTFGEEINKAYYIEYETIFLGAPNGNIENKADLTYTGITKGIKEDVEKKFDYWFSGSGSTKKVQLKLIKEDKKNEDKLKGAKFALYNSNDILLFEGTTDEDGKLIVPYKLGEGKYKLVEKEAPKGYLKNNEIEVELKYSNIENEYQTKTIKNKELYQAVALTKIDESGRGLSGAEFKLIDKSTELSLEKDANGKSLPEIFITGLDGKISINDLPVGEYYFKEIKAPIYYIKTDKNYDFTITEDQLDLKEVTVENTRGNGKIKIIKEDAENSEIKLKDVEFKLIDPAGAEVSAITDKDGIIIFEELEYDKYTLIETKALEGYKLDGNPIEVVLDGEVNNIEKEITIKNIPKTRVTGRKVWNGGSTPRPTIELQLYRDGVKFGSPVELKDGETEYTWKDLDRTDINGKVYSYTIDEVNVPSRYRKSISNNGLTITNEYRPGGGGGGRDPEPRPDPEDPVDPPKEDPKDPEEPDTPEDPETEDPTDPSEPGTQDPEDPDEPEDPEEPLIPIVLDPPTKGNVTINEDGSWTYTPEPGATGEDSFIITHPDGREELIEIDLDDLPLGTTSVKDGQPIISKVEEKKDDQPLLPKTGDKGKLGFYMAGMILIGLGVFLKRKRTA